MLGVDIPIANAPMGGVVTRDLVAATAEAGAIGVLPNVMTWDRESIRAVRELTARPLGANIHAGAAEKTAIDVFVEEGIRFVSTCIGPVPTNVPQMQEAGLKVFHVVTSLDEAQRAANVGVDGLVVEGFEAAARARWRGGAADGAAAARDQSDRSPGDRRGRHLRRGIDGGSVRLLGAEGVSMGTRMIASAESAVHDNYKRAVVSGMETDTIVINRHTNAPLRVLRTDTTSKYLDAD